MVRYLDPKNDLTFKRVFGEHKHLCISLWLRFLTEVNENTEEIPQELLENEELREAVGYMEKAAYTKEQLIAYDKWKVDLITARSMLDDAEAIGEQKKAVIIAQNLLKRGMPIDDIVDTTGLSKQQIEELKKNS